MALQPRALVGIANLAKQPLMNGLKTLNLPNPPQTTVSVPNFGVFTIVQLDISGGHINPISISFDPTVSQSANGKFTAQGSVTANIQYSDWHETDTITVSGGFSSTSDFHSDQFIIHFTPLTLSMTIQVALDKKNELVATLTDSHLVKKNFSFSLPRETAIKSSIFPCFNKAVDDQISNQIAGTADKFASVAGSSLNTVFSAIPSTANLTENISFDFHGTPNGLTFPGDKGVQYRVLGEVKYKGTKAPGVIGTVPFPDVPTDHDGAFNANNYEFNALLWAFFQDGKLHANINKTNTTYQPALNTDYYKGSMAQALCDAYPNRNLIIEIEPTQAPTVILKEDKPGEGYATITYTGTMTWWIAKTGSETEKDVEAFTLSLTDVDNLKEFSVGTNENIIQVIRFRVQEVMSYDVKLKSSNIPGLSDHDDFGLIWKFVFQPQYAYTLNGAAQAGVALPSTLQEIFTNYKINIHSGYVTVAVNFTSLKKYNAIHKARFGYELGPKTVGHINFG